MWTGATQNGLKAIRVRGHPFMTCTRRGKVSGSGGVVDPWGWGRSQLHVDIHTKIRAH